MKNDLTKMLRERLDLADPVALEFQRGEIKVFDGFVREKIEYRGLEDDVIPAFLFTPKGSATLGGVVVFHQHNGEFHFGKSEVAGELGDAFQAFGPRSRVEASQSWPQTPSPSRIDEARFGGWNRITTTGFSTTAP